MNDIKKYYKTCLINSNKKSLADSNIVKKVFTFFYIISYVLCGFVTGISFLTIGTIILIGLFFFSLFIIDFRNFSYNKYRQNGFIYAIYFFIVFFLSISLSFFHVSVSYWEMFVRFVIWGLVTYFALFTQDLIDFAFAKKILIFVAIFSTAYLFFQIFLYEIFGFKLIFNLFQKTHGMYSAPGMSSDFVRFCGFYAEPAHYGYPVSIGMLLYLLYTKHSFIKKYTVALLLLLGLIFTTSTTAIIVGFLVLAIGLYYDLKERKVLLFLIMTIFIIGIVIFLLSDSEIAKYFLAKLETARTADRVKNIFFYNKLLPMFEQFFGVGAGNEEFFLLNVVGLELGYANSLALTFLYGGYFLVIILFIMCIALFKINKGKIRMLLLITFVICLGTGELYQNTVPFILVLASAAKIYGELK